MLELSVHLPLTVKNIASKNLCDKLEEEDLEKLGAWVHEGYIRDKASRSKWERRTEAAMDLAMQISKDKTFPWPGCSNVAFPLVTIACQQFHSRAYPAIINGKEVVKMRVIGEDPKGEKMARAERVGAHMSWQVLEQDADWEEQQDRLLLNVACVGTAFKKSYYSPGRGYNESDLVFARDLVFDYWSKSVEECPRKTHVIPFFRNDIYERVKRGTFKDILKAPWYEHPASPRTESAIAGPDNRRGLNAPLPDENTPFTCLEQHVTVDLDGDGYAEPYIITIEENSKAVLRIVTGFEREEDIDRVAGGPGKGDIIAIRAAQYFTKYGFIPSPDGGVMDIGFGVLLGPLNESVNSAINQIFDSGTMHTLGGGFLGRGAKIRGGVYTVGPYEWKRVDSSGDDLRKSLVPLPTKEPSAVLFQLLVLLINYAQRVAGATDPMVGEMPGQNTPAETSRNVMAEGMKIYNDLFKRIWRSMKEEFKKLYILNAMYLPERAVFGQGKHALREDYLGNPDEIIPVADPNITSEQMAVMQMSAVLQRASSAPGYDRFAVERRWLKTMKVDGVDQIFLAEKAPPLPNPKVMVEQMKLQGKQMQMKHEQAMFVGELLEQRRVNDAKILELQAKARLETAEAGGIAAGHQIAAFNAAIGALKVHNDALNAQIDHVLKFLESGMEGAENEAGSGDGGAVPRLAGASGDPGGQAGAGAQAGGAA